MLPDLEFLGSNTFESWHSGLLIGAGFFIAWKSSVALLLHFEMIHCNSSESFWIAMNYPELQWIIPKVYLWWIPVYDFRFHQFSTINRLVTVSQTTNIPHYHIPKCHEDKISEKCDPGGIFGSCANITDDLRIKIILMPIESPEFALSIGTKIDSVRKSSTLFA